MLFTPSSIRDWKSLNISTFSLLICVNYGFPRRPDFIVTPRNDSALCVFARPLQRAWQSVPLFSNTDYHPSASSGQACLPFASFGLTPRNDSALCVIARRRRRRGNL